MKTKLFPNAAMAALVAVIFSVLTGCGSTPATPAATDLVRALGGKAKVEGGTVVLTGTVILTEYVQLKTALTVPAGVTLDLTADGAALELQDGAVLTVNGTVNALGYGDHGNGWVQGSLRIGDGRAVIAGNGTIYLMSKGRLLNIGSDKVLRQLTLDGVTLVGLPDNDSPLIGIGENSEFVLKSGAITGNLRMWDNDSSGGGVVVWRGTFIMEGGSISGNTAHNGGGVFVEESTFTMKGGIISGNTASDNAGAVMVQQRSSFTMEGGIISGNTAAFGGGVRVGEQATFIMEGGTIYGSSAEGGNANTAPSGAALRVFDSAIAAKWGTGGTYTKGGIPQTGGSDIVPNDPRNPSSRVNTNDTLIAIPGKQERL
jgi:hypothetical protein